MNEVPNDRLQDLIDQLRIGDEAAREDARQKLIGVAAERLHRLARKILRKSFRRLGNAHETGSVLSESAVRLMTALRQVHPTTVEDFFGLAARHMRFVLLDMLRNNTHGHQGLDSEVEPVDRCESPEAVARWTEFHRAVEELPDEEREIVNVCWYLGVKQAVAAKLLGLHPREVSRRWVSAWGKLPNPEA